MPNSENEYSYDDIINLPHHVSEKRPQMSPQSRAAQFSPFAALTGYEDAVTETARLTDARTELTEDGKNALDKKMQLLAEHIDEAPAVTVTYFLPDPKKEGGSFVSISGYIRTIDEYEHTVVFTDGARIPICDICGIESEIFVLGNF